MASGTEIPQIPVPREDPEPVVAEDATTTATTSELEDIAQTAAFVAEVSSIMNLEDVKTILATQADIQQKWKESNESLTSFNEFSATMYNNLSGEYEKHTKALKDMKKDLDNVFKRIRQLQSMLRQKYPESFMNTSTS